MTNRSYRGLRAVVVLAAGAACAATLAAAPAGADPDDPARRAEITQGLLTPLSLAVQTNGTYYVAQNFAGVLMRGHRGAAPQPVASAAEGSELGAVSVRNGVVTYAVSRGHNEEGFIRQIRGGRNRLLADIGAVEAADNPDGENTYGFEEISPECEAQLPDGAPATYTGIDETHPFATAMRGATVFVADAGANAIFSVGPAGNVRAVTAMPAQPAELSAEGAEEMGFPECTVGLSYDFEAVPTDIELGPDGMLYVTVLPGGPESPSMGPRGKVYRVDPATGDTMVVLGGLVTPTGLAVAGNGDMYINELFAGRVNRLRGDSLQVFKFRALPSDVEVVGRHVWATVNVLPQGPPDGRVVRWNMNNQLPPQCQSLRTGRVC